jgi:[NiFe] hydrogenase diaphorase moiety large subunit
MPTHPGDTPRSATTESTGKRIAAPGSHDSLLQTLVREQYDAGGISETAMGRIASHYGTSVGEVRGVVHFYNFLDTTPGITHDIRISDNIVDQMSGGRELMALISQLTGTRPADSRAGGPARLDFTSCIGLSDQGPSLLANGLAIPRVDAQRAGEIAHRILDRVPVTQWPGEWFRVESNIRCVDRLLGECFEPASALLRARRIGSGELLAELERSGLRGRGGAGFPTALKWRLCSETPAARRVVVCNADEGEPGTFKDRVLISDHAPRLIEGMAVCASVIGADTGMIYLRGEYRNLLAELKSELDRQRAAGILGEHFDIHVHLGAGAYICGEESALIESLEGRRGIPRIRPPFPVVSGYMGHPTVVNNVETFISAAMVAALGPEWLRSRGTPKSAGTRLLSVSGDCAEPGIYEIPFGITIAEVLERCSARSTQAVQIGGPAGALVPSTRFDHRISHEDYSTGGSFMIFDDSRDLLDVVRNFTSFFTHESCGFCTPCRVGGALLGKRLRKVVDGHATGADLDAMRSFASVMKRTSHCGLGQTAANPVVDLMNHFPKVMNARLRSTSFEPAFDLDASLEEARQLTGRDDPGAYIKGSGV